MHDATRPRSATRQELLARISCAASDHAVCRAERLLLRALERQWPDARLDGMLARLLERVSTSSPSGPRP